MMSSAWLPEVVGDPARMRALASSLRGEASAVALRTSYLEATAKATTFEGPAGNEFRARLSAWNSQADAVVQELVGTANLLESTATQVEGLQRDRALRLQEIADAARKGLP